jgi:glycosyltransferase involved in cell wall biosynthesis
MRTLHVAALPFPSPQGTQALLLQMLCALSERGHDTHLLCYGHGAAREHADAQPFTVHRLRVQSSTRSLRSGPSLDKLRLDAALALQLRGLRRALAPDLVVAHHVEAAACASLSRLPFVFVAHTGLAAELPTYLGARAAVLTPLARRLGRELERGLVRRATRALAVSPLLASELAQESCREVEAVPLPWRPAPSITLPERLRARAALGYDACDEVALYAGNLDAYQGLDTLLPALARVRAARPRLRVLIATESSPRVIAAQLEQLGLARCTRLVPLAGERARRCVHAAADLALVPRRSPGGVPIKLLDALARGVPTVAARRALAGLPLDPHCEVVDDEAPRAWDSALHSVLRQPVRAHERATSAQAYMQTAHDPGRFVDALCALGSTRR